MLLAYLPNMQLEREIETQKTINRRQNTHLKVKTVRRQIS